MNGPLTGGRRELVWRSGVNDTDLGPMIWNDRARRETMGVYQRRGNPVLLDLNHNYSEDLRSGWEMSGEPAPTAGNATLEVDAQGNLWMIPDWSKIAREKIEGKELRFLSPDFAYDKKTNEILEIYRISLVAEPGTWRARMVASANRKKGRLAMGVSPELLSAITDMARLMAAEQVSDALQEAINKVVTLSGGGSSEPMDPVDLAKPAAGMDPAKPDAIVSRNLTLARKQSAEVATLTARRLSDEKRLAARAELKLTPAEEQALAPINNPDELDRAIGVLRASRAGTGKATLGREGIADRAAEALAAAEAAKKKPTGNPYLDAMMRHGLGVTS